eukprot:XP_001703963.1 Hypothetical protein GL50803_119037 [Giardia lamblia ATCC 50803]
MKASLSQATSSAESLLHLTNPRVARRLRSWSSSSSSSLRWPASSSGGS